MGGIPSREAPHTFFSLRYGTHEVGLIPLLHRYFHKENVELRRQFIRMRNDPSVRYNFMRNSEYNMTELPPSTYTEEKLDQFLDIIDGLLYNTTEEMLNDENSPLRPIPCAVCFIYINGREGGDCFSFYGRRINIIGQFGCYKYEDKLINEPELYLQRVILKAAGDRTLERVVTISAKVLKEEFLRAMSNKRPLENGINMFTRRFSLLPLIISTSWNSYPALKFLYDTVVLNWAIGNIHKTNIDNSNNDDNTNINNNNNNNDDDDDDLTFMTQEIDKEGKGGGNEIIMKMSGPLLLRYIHWMCSTLLPSTVRGSWEQFILNDILLQEKEKKISTWLLTSPNINNFFGGKQLTERIQKHLILLLSEIVRARETPYEDLTFWCKEQECSHDGKIYCIFKSPLCGPFLTTIKPKRDKKSDTSSDLEFNHHKDDNNNNDNNNKHINYTHVKKQKHKSTKSHVYNLKLPPKYQEAVKNNIPSPFISPSTQNIQSFTLPNTTLQSNTNSVSMSFPSMLMMQMSPGVTQKSLTFPSDSSQIVPTFLPVYQDTSTLNTYPMQSLVMPYVMIDSSIQQQKQQLSTSTVTQPNYITVNQENMNDCNTTNTNNNNNNNITTMTTSKNSTMMTTTNSINNNNNSMTNTTRIIDGKNISTKILSSEEIFNMNTNMSLLSNIGNEMRHMDSIFMQQPSNYVLLPDGRIGLLNSTQIPSMGYWK